MVARAYSSYYTGYNGSNDSPTFILSHHYKIRPEGIHKLIHLPTYKMVNKKTKMTSYVI